jgi:aflatoxin B1 aldehyde reductase
MSAKPRVILGLMTFGPDENAGARITDLETFEKILDGFKAHGYVECDTARIYVGGQQEGWTRQAGWQEKGLEMHTKYYPLTAGAHQAESITQQVETSLKELGTDCFEVGTCSYSIVKS